MPARSKAAWWSLCRKQETAHLECPKNPGPLSESRPIYLSDPRIYHALTVSSQDLKLRTMMAIFGLRWLAHSVKRVISYRMSEFDVIMNCLAQNQRLTGYRIRREAKRF